MQYDLLHIQGKPYVLVALHDYRALSTASQDTGLPDDVLDMLAAGTESPVKIIRKHRSMTQHDLAQKSGISRPYIAEIETGKKEGSLAAFKALAAALGVTIESLIRA